MIETITLVALILVSLYGVVRVGDAEPSAAKGVVFALLLTWLMVLGVIVMGIVIL